MEQKNFPRPGTKSHRSKKHGRKDETKIDPEVSRYIYRCAQRRNGKEYILKKIIEDNAS